MAKKKIACKKCKLHELDGMKHRCLHKKNAKKVFDPISGKNVTKHPQCWEVNQGGCELFEPET